MTIKTNSPEFQSSLAKWRDTFDIPSEGERLRLALEAYEAAKPSADEINSYLISVLADIRMVTGLREKPMLSELAAAIGQLMQKPQPSKESA